MCHERGDSPTCGARRSSLLPCVVAGGPKSNAAPRGAAVPQQEAKVLQPSPPRPTASGRADRLNWPGRAPCRVRPREESAMLEGLRRYTREQRLKRFNDFMSVVTGPVRLIDLGGTIKFWENWGLAKKPLLDVTVVNSHELDKCHQDDPITLPN